MLDELIGYVERFQTLIAGALAIGAGWLAYRGAVRQAKAAIDASQLQIKAEHDVRIAKLGNDAKTLAAILQLQIAAYLADLISLQWQISEAVRLQKALSSLQPQLVRGLTKPDFARYHWQELALMGPHLAGGVLNFVDHVDQLIQMIQRHIPQAVAAGATAEQFSVVARPFIDLLGKQITIGVKLCEQLSKITPGIIDLDKLSAGITTVWTEVQKNPHIQALRKVAGLNME